MNTPDSPRTQPASTDTAEPHEPGQYPTSLDPRLTWPRPFVDQPASAPRRVSRRMPRFTPASPDRGPGADAPAPPLPQRPHARPALPAAQGGAPAAALSPGRHGASAA